MNRSALLQHDENIFKQLAAWQNRKTSANRKTFLRQGAAQKEILQENMRPRSTPIIAGADEVGRGALAGPLVTCVACIDESTLQYLLQPLQNAKPQTNTETSARGSRHKIRPVVGDSNKNINKSGSHRNVRNKTLCKTPRNDWKGNYWAHEVNDSKKISAKKREQLCARLQHALPAYAISVVSAARIDRMNVVNASKWGILQGALRLAQRGFVANTLLLDALSLQSLPFLMRQAGFPPPLQCPIVKGDTTSWLIAAASILAKVARDKIITALAATNPSCKMETGESEEIKNADLYHLAQNKGYGVRQHRQAIAKYGLSPLHRKTFTRKFLRL